MTLLLPSETRVRPVRCIGEILLKSTRDTNIRIRPEITEQNPLGGNEDVESGPYKELLLANYTLELGRRPYPALPNNVRYDTLADIMVENDATLMAVTHDLRAEALIEHIARRYITITGKKARTFVKPPFGFLIETDFRSSNSGVGTIARLTLEGIKRVGLREAIRLWDETSSDSVLLSESQRA